MGEVDEEYEIMAAKFYKETGIMAPGKDCAPGSGQMDFEQRADAWDDWLMRKLQKARP